MKHRLFQFPPALGNKLSKTLYVVNINHAITNGKPDVTVIQPMKSVGVIEWK